MSTDEPAPDSGMMSGSDAGEPGEHLADPELGEADRRLLEALTRSTEPVVHAAEDEPEMVRAAEDDAPLPTAPPERDEPDPLDPVFRSPED